MIVMVPGEKFQFGSGVPAAASASRFANNGACSQRDVLAKAGACRGRIVEGGRIAFVQGHHLGRTGCDDRARGASAAGKHQTCQLAELGS